MGRARPPGYPGGRGSRGFMPKHYDRFLSQDLMTKYHKLAGEIRTLVDVAGPRKGAENAARDYNSGSGLPPMPRRLLEQQQIPFEDPLEVLREVLGPGEDGRMPYGGGEY